MYLEGISELLRKPWDGLYVVQKNQKESFDSFFLNWQIYMKFLSLIMKSVKIYKFGGMFSLKGL